MHNNGRWSEGRYRGFITSALRRASAKWPPKFDSLAVAFTSKKINPKSGKLAKHYRCNVCKKEFTSTNVQVDHIIPIGKCESWDEFIEKLFCESDNLQVVCKPDHKKKTKEERSENK